MTTYAPETRTRTSASKGGKATETEPGAPTPAFATLMQQPTTPYFLLLGASCLLLVLGLVMVFSASSVVAFQDFGSSLSIVRKQMTWVVIGLPAMWLASRLPVRLWRLSAYVGLIASLALLLLVVKYGTDINGNKNWLDFGGPFRIQPSELAKLALVLWCSDLLARKERLLGQWKHLLLPMLPVGALVLVLVLAGGDLGTAIIIAALLASLLWFAGAPLRLYLAFAVPALLVVTWMVNTRSARMSRITVWLHPSQADPLNEGLQSLHGKFALASGGWWGVGLGASKEKWGDLPEAHTDFIFAIIGEELGLLGTLAVVGLFGVIGYAGLRIAVDAVDPFVRYAAAGATTWLMVQAIVNMGAVLGLLPITGVPLPLVSYGGSALLPTMLAVGMLLSFCRPRRPRRSSRSSRPRRHRLLSRLRHRQVA